MDYLSIFKTNLHDLQNPLDSLNSENPLKKIITDTYCTWLFIFPRIHVSLVPTISFASVTRCHCYLDNRTMSLTAFRGTSSSGVIVDKLNKQHPRIEKNIYTLKTCLNQTLNKMETSLNLTLNKTESCINRTLTINKIVCHNFIH